MPHVRPDHRRTPVVVLVVLAIVIGAAPAAEAAGGHLPPVEGAVVDPWRPPESPYGAGNRGIDYRTRPGAAVVASEAGEVTFAGQVGGALHVVVLHADGLRTSYSFLRSIEVDRGQRVGRGEALGTAGERVHLGARAGDRYLDPSLLWGGGGTEVHLVPTDPPPTTAAQERSWLGAIAAGAAGWGGAAGQWAAGATVASPAARAAKGFVAAAFGAATAADVPALAASGVAEAAGGWARAVAHLRSLDAAADAFERSQEGCTPVDTPTPRPPAGRRIAVLVAGFGSTGGRAGILDLDTAGLGYEPDDVAQFSYRGGRVAGVGDLPGTPVSTYTSSDAMGDLPTAGRHLRDLLAAIATAHPGVPVDVIAHSQGGVVARAALGAPAGSPTTTPVANLVTLGAPHDGADWATAGAVLASTRAGGFLDRASDRLLGDPVGATAVATSQMAEGSEFLRSLAAAPVPAAVRTTSIAARGDVVVPALHSALDGARLAMIPLAGPSTHGDLPGSASAHREVALALAGAGPTCRRLGADLLLAAAISLAEDGIGLLAGSGARLVDASVAAVDRSAVAVG